MSIAFGVPGAGLASEYSSTSVETVEYDDVIDDSDDVSSAQKRQSNVAAFGPFFVIDQRTAELDGTIDSSTPAAFKRLLEHYPEISTIRMIECPGSEDDDANLQLARMVRGAGINTHVPANGSIRSGGVELFLAGVKRTAEPGAEFGVHSWQDEDGLEAEDYAANDPVHANYVNYYVDMGLKPEVAKAFYAFTNKAAPHDGVYYMKPVELSQFSILN